MSFAYQYVSIIQLFLQPYRLVHDANSCILCGGSRGRNANPRDKCVCISMTCIFNDVDVIRVDLSRSASDLA